MTGTFSLRRAMLPAAALILSAGVYFTPLPAQAQVTAFKQAVAEAAARDDDIASFYRANGYTPIWTGSSDEDRARRAELMRAIKAAAAHGLPVARYDPEGLMAQLRAVRSTRDRGLAEVAMSKVFLQYARDIQTGVINNPRSVDDGIVRKIPHRDRSAHLRGIANARPAAFFRALPPRSMEYNALLKEKGNYSGCLWGVSDA